MNADDGPAGVPVAWLCAQDGAARVMARVMARGGVCWSVGSFEYRSVHDVLALTLLMSGCGPDPGLGQAGLLRALLADDVEWAVWCTGRLAHETGLAVADADQARRAMGWLTGSRLLAGSFYEAIGRCTVDAERPGAGVGLGVTLSRRLLDTLTPGPSCDPGWYGLV